MGLVLFGARRARMAAIALVLALLLSTGSFLASAADKRGGKAWLGVAMTPAPSGGLRLEHVFPSSPAARIALRAGDVVLRADGVPLSAPADLVDHVKRHEPGMTLELLVARGGAEERMSVVLESHPGEEQVQRLMHVGKPAVDLLAARAVQGTVPARMSEMRGRVVVLEFFASWCGNCRLLAPELSRLQERFHKRGLTVVGITSDAEDEARETARRWGISYAVGSDAGGRTHSAYGVSALPSTYFIDRKGIVREVMIGFDKSRRAATEKLVEKLLAER